MNPDDFMAFKLMNCSFLGLFRGLQNYDEKTYSVFPKQCLDQILVPECFFRSDLSTKLLFRSDTSTRTYFRSDLSI